jgi:hypothetical protein
MDWRFCAAVRVVRRDRSVGAGAAVGRGRSLVKRFRRDRRRRRRSRWRRVSDEPR